jgi:hypothetical protein
VGTLGRNPQGDPVVLRALLFEDCVASIATSKKDKTLGRKLRKMLVPVE